MASVEKEELYNNILHRLLKKSEKLKIGNSDKIVILSDLHIGNGRKNDDFKKNAGLVSFFLQDYYLKKDFTLILNGDVEELQKFNLKNIEAAWKPIFNIFEKFIKRKQFYKIIGNHDYRLLTGKPSGINSHLLPSLILQYRKEQLFLFHGHQASLVFDKYNAVLGFFLRYFISPLGIPNYSVSNNNQKRFKVEQRVYRFSRKEKIISIIGHTHRPLFESLSKRDTLRFRLEKLLRKYPGINPLKKKKVEKEIHRLRDEILSQDKNERFDIGSFYNNDVIIPLLFNSGCAIGKKGATCLEIENGHIALVHWYDAGQYKNSRPKALEEPEQIEGSPFTRMVLKREPLNYIFTRVRLLTKS